MLITADQLKDLALFNSFKGMQFELLAAQNGQEAQALAKKLGELEGKTKELHGRAEAAMAQSGQAIETTKALDQYLAKVYPEYDWRIEDILSGRVVLMPCTADIAAGRGTPMADIAAGRGG